MSKPGIITVSLSTVKSLPDKDRSVLRNYVMGGSKTEARYRDEPEVRKILFGEPESKAPQIAPSEREELAGFINRLPCLQDYQANGDEIADAIIAKGWRKVPGNE